MKPGTQLMLALLLLLEIGCAGTGKVRDTPSHPTVRWTPDTRLHGRVASLNQQGQFVVVDFNVGRIPPLNTQMNVYRKNQIVGVINLSGPVNDNLVAGDIVNGSPAVGDVAIWDNTTIPARPAK